MNATPHVLLTRKTRFSAGHRYHRDDWSAEKNRAVFGACNNPWGHGHNYELEVTIAGPVDPETGMVLNLREVDAILNEEIIARFDHRFINKEVSGFETLVPTTENLTLYMWDLLAPRFTAHGAVLHSIRLWETQDLYAEYRGEVVGDPSAEGAP